MQRRLTGSRDADGNGALPVDRNAVGREVNGERRMFVNAEHGNTCRKRSLKFAQLDITDEAARGVVCCPFGVIPVRHNGNAKTEHRAEEIHAAEPVRGEPGLIDLVDGNR